MSFQPFPRTWYSWIARTIAADSDREYEFDPTVWWTSAKRTARAYVGADRRMRSLAPHAERERIRGDEAVETPRNGTASASLRTKYARNRRTRPRSRYWIRSDEPVQYGLPSCQARERRASPLTRSGRSSASGAAGFHDDQRPAV